MPQLKLESTKSTPGILFDTDSGIYKVGGIATPLNAYEYFKNIADWLKENEAQILSGSVFKFNLPYFNSASAKGLMLLLTALKAMLENGTILEIIWYVEPADEFMIEAGEMYQEILGLPIRIEESEEYRS
ncbi:MAG: DUF1987 domain-containing protein [Crocinitomicaceae bacterium]|nr:DUF1987 domain-containing protein [Crocinitomicaceae bacterium]